MKRIRNAAVSTALTAIVIAGGTVLAASPASAAPARDVAASGPVNASAYYCGYDNRVTPPTIRYGSSGNTVREAQCLLISLGYSVGSSGIDGQFGPATRSAVYALQADYGLSYDGIVGPQTWNCLRNC
ncbi:peptidoglycan-binding protein [Streptomyces sp. NBC_01352]|uniref:Peptidoglycan binding-like domain-containing protein n=1 Tax=Streptomyces plumbiresistens TaxID=511811 RepID=A0ABP7TR43_9ACTN|nr:MULTISPECIES: peptidoglycan-binding domain-containing protein [unclassified Streptomyces]MCX4703999.1 peptidoglycan-binding protein [Streptomyces sp. NBC_01373]